jgi:hypothetical protein
MDSLLEAMALWLATPASNISLVTSVYVENGHVYLEYTARVNSAGFLWSGHCEATTLACRELDWA